MMSVSIETIRGFLAEFIPTNKSGGEVSLSVGESLLLVLDASEKGGVTEPIMDKLNQLYLEGLKTEDDKAFIRQLTKLLAEKNYTVKSDFKTINEDPTRRYFETQLAYHILQNNAESLNQKDLQKFTRNLKDRLLSLPGTEAEKANIRTGVEKILCGDMDDKVLNKYEMEYAELIHQLMNNNFHGLSPKACKNLYEIACCSILATLNTQVDKSMPVDIYSDSIFTMGMDGRGRLIKPTHDQVRTTAKGLMRSTSPLPLYGDVVNPVGDDYQGVDVHSPFQRSADQSDFMPESDWSQHLFARQTHPYSNGISSTTLAQLRNIVLQKRLGHPHHGKSLEEYMTSFAALMLYNSGGHSFFEIFEVFKLPQLNELMVAKPSVATALAEDNLMYKWLCKDQPEAFTSALKSSKEYIRTLLNKKMVHAAILEGTDTRQTMRIVGGKIGVDKAARLHQRRVAAEIKRRAMIGASLHQAVLSKDDKALNRLMRTPDRETINAENAERWSPLMVASQQGKTKHVRELLEASADIEKSVGNLSSLELAIKARKFETVQFLLSAGAKIKKIGVDLMTMSTDPTNPSALKARLNNKASYVLYNSNIYYIEAGTVKANKISVKGKNVKAIFPKEMDVLQEATQADLTRITSATGHPLLDSIVRTAPALYFGCRQSDMRILQLILDGSKFSITDKKEAILAALKVENLEALKVLVAQFNDEEKREYFTPEYRDQLLNEAVCLGNTRLIQGIVDLNLCPVSNKTDYLLLLKTAMDKRFLPAAKSLLDLLCASQVALSEPQKKELSIILNKTLISELRKENFEMAMLTIIYGADPAAIPLDAPYLRPFRSYLGETQSYDLLFSEQEMRKISDRAKEITRPLKESRSGIRQTLLKYIVIFLNLLLPARLRLNYNDTKDTGVMDDISLALSTTTHAEDKGDVAVKDATSPDQSVAVPRPIDAYAGAEPASPQGHSSTFFRRTAKENKESIGLIESDSHVENPPKPRDMT